MRQAFFLHLDGVFNEFTHHRMNKARAGLVIAIIMQSFSRNPYAGDNRRAVSPFRRGTNDAAFILDIYWTRRTNRLNFLPKSLICLARPTGIEPVFPP
jgi:hypothetical protein